MPSVHADPTFKSDLPDSLHFILSFTRNSGISGVMCKKSLLHHFEFLIVYTKQRKTRKTLFSCKQKLFCVNKFNTGMTLFFFATCQKNNNNNPGDVSFVFGVN